MLNLLMNLSEYQNINSNQTIISKWNVDIASNIYSVIPVAAARAASPPFACCRAVVCRAVASDHLYCAILAAAFEQCSVATRPRPVLPGQSHLDCRPRVSPPRMSPLQCEPSLRGCAASPQAAPPVIGNSANDDTEDEMHLFLLQLPGRRLKWKARYTTLWKKSVFYILGI